MTKPEKAFFNNMATGWLGAAALLTTWDHRLGDYSRACATLGVIALIVWLSMRLTRLVQERRASPSTSMDDEF